MKLRDIQDPQILGKALIYAGKSFPCSDSKYLLKKDLEEAFIWGETEEGHAYWSTMYKEYKEEQERKKWFMETFCS